jgi:hypothetical protein
LTVKRTLASCAWTFGLVASAAAAEPAPGSNLLESPATAIAVLSARIAKDARVLNLDLRRDGFDVEVQDAAAPAHVDRFTFEDGTFGGPEPVPVGRNRKRLEAQLFPLSEVDLRVLPQLLADAVERARTEDGQVTHVRIERTDRHGDSEGWGRPVMRIHVDGPRGGAFVEYTLDGKKKSVSRW